MMKKAVLIGTSHSIQRNDSEFKSYIEELCNEHNICAIAEEIDNECTSIASGVAKKLDIAYKIIEPTLQEAVALGIEEVHRIDYEFMMAYGLDDSSTAKNITIEVYNEYNTRKMTTYRQREDEWFKRIQELDTWPVLVICGSDHVEPFYDLLSNHGIFVQKKLFNLNF